jgi:hypothetical protein
MVTTSGHLNRSSRDFGHYEIRVAPSSMPLSVRFRTDSAMTPYRGLPSLSTQRAISSLLGWVLSMTFRGSFDERGNKVR